MTKFVLWTGRDLHYTFTSVSTVFSVRCKMSVYTIYLFSFLFTVSAIGSWLHFGVRIDGFYWTSHNIHTHKQENVNSSCWTTQSATQRNKIIPSCTFGSSRAIQIHLINWQWLNIINTKYQKKNKWVKSVTNRRELIRRLFCSLPSVFWANSEEKMWSRTPSTINELLLWVDEWQKEINVGNDIFGCQVMSK